MNLLLQNLSIISLIVMGIPMLLFLILVFSKKKISENTNIYLYAFSTGMLVVLATFGLMGESLHELEGFFKKNPNMTHTNEILTEIGIIGGGAVLGLILAVCLKTVVFKIQKTKTFSHDGHSDSKCCVVNIEELIHKNGKIASIFIISTHKFIDGISLGVLANSATTLFAFENLGTIILFLLHDLPIFIIIFYIQKSLNMPNKKIFWYSLLLSFITVPFIFIGGFLGNWLEDSLPLFMPFIESMIGAILLFTTLMEIVPEFIHNHHLCSKHWYITVAWLSFGMILSIVLNLIHVH